MEKINYNSVYILRILQTKNITEFNQTYGMEWKMQEEGMHNIEASFLESN
jgi:hypothetical protein